MKKIDFEQEVYKTTYRKLKNNDNKKLRFIVMIKNRKDKSFKGFIVAKTTKQLFNKIKDQEKKGGYKYGKMFACNCEGDFLL